MMNVKETDESEADKLFYLNVKRDKFVKKAIEILGIIKNAHGEDNSILVHNELERTASLIIACDDSKQQGLYRELGIAPVIGEAQSLEHENLQNIVRSYFTKSTYKDIRAENKWCLADVELLDE